MDNDREFDQVLMNVRGATGSIITASLFSARITFQMLVYLARLVKKGLLAVGFTDRFKAFMGKTEGNYTVYNIPLAGDKAANLIKMNELELKLQEERNPLRKAGIRNEIKTLQKEMPEIEQLDKLGITYCVLPKLNGSNQTIQVAVSKNDDQLFKNWFINHLTTGLSGGEKGIEDIRVFTEGNYTIFNVPFEGEELAAAFPDFETLGINYAILPDLNVGDGNSQLAVPNADRSKLEVWFKMWKNKQLKDGKEPGEMYAMDQNSYMNTGTMEAEEYVAASEPAYQAVNAEFEKQAQDTPWLASLGKENSEEYVRYLQDGNYEKITINKETLVEKMNFSQKTAEMQKNGYFVSRIPGTYGEGQKTLILPVNQVFRADNDKTFVAFVPKNAPCMVADSQGNVSKWDYNSVYKPYDKVTRNMHNVKEYVASKGSMTINKNLNPGSLKQVKEATPKIKP